MPAGKLLENQTVLITGASRGVGECLAHCLAHEGARLILVAESDDGLKEVAERCKAEGCPGVEVQTCDLSDPAAVQKLADGMKGKVDVAIMNAGVFAGSEEDVLKGNPEDWERMMKINALAPMRMIRTLAPDMCSKGKGAIVCIGDVEAVHTGPRHAAYAASKYALRGFCKSTYEAVRGSGVRVMTVSAGNISGTAMAEETGKAGGGQGAIEPQDVAEAVMLSFRCSPNCVAEEIRLFGGGAAKPAAPSAEELARAAARSRLLDAVKDQQRGLKTSKQQRDEVLAAAAELAELQGGAATTDADSLSATWQLVWTTEKETLFILENARWFGTAAGEVYQVIDVAEQYLQNVITFPLEGAFIVDSDIAIEGDQRTAFKFSGATLQLPLGRALSLPPFGQGWFDTIYCDDDLRVAQDSRGDTLVVNVQNVHRFFQSNSHKYGAIWRMRILNNKVVVLGDPRLVLAVVSRKNELQKAPEIYDTVDYLFSPTGRRSFFNTHDAEEWRLVRKSTAPAFSLDNIRKAFPLLMRTTNEVCDVLAARAAANGGEVEAEVAEAGMRITLDVIGQTLAGYDFHARTYARCELLEAIPPLLAEFTMRSTNPLRALLHALLPFKQESRLFRQRVKTCHKWWDTLLASVRSLDLAAADAGGDTSLRACLARAPIKDDLLRPQLAAYLVAGFETTAHSIAWALYEIASHPEVQAKLGAELAARGLLGPGARPLEFSDLAELSYLNCVLKESMRLHPVASSGTVRKADKALTLGGYRLSAGTIIWCPLISLLTSSHNWERAEDFWPERWADEGAAAAAAAAAQRQALGGGDGAAPCASAPTPLGHAAQVAKSYLPFSDGPRDCIGQNLALMEARAVLATMLGRFELSVAPRMGNREAVRGAEVMKLTLQCKTGIHLGLKSRGRAATSDSP
ncbi:cytochrome P450 [Micractinium conductrix]|uniref:Cytochrome P450 n=1 Tax=Micractinium conductrix TaxID=554055 RepID=A0A2P6VAJ4_9CHLO|nr:cytochrome P450 [Micractinium conductrix]|eukprot:PSC71095.1 cytochrome P450 [Micractinium conductrix]